MEHRTMREQLKFFKRILSISTSLLLQERVSENYSLKEKRSVQILVVIDSIQGIRSRDYKKKQVCIGRLRE